MRRRIDYNYQGGFGGRERARLLGLLVMLALVGMLILRARDPRMWVMFGNETPEPDAVVGADEAASPNTTKTSASAAEKSSAGLPEHQESAVEKPTVPAAETAPLDQDPEELAALHEELSVVADKSGFEFDKVEMAAYWRLMRFSLSQSFSEMQRKAIKKPQFGDIFLHPDKYRGKLVELRLHVKQAFQFKGDDIEKGNPAGVTKLYEVRGFTDNSSPMVYWCVCPELPKGMPLGDKVMDEGWFVGYFLKLITYVDHEDKHRATPVLIGRFQRIAATNQAADPKAQARDWFWGVSVAAVLGVLFFLRWTLRRILGSGKADSTRAATNLARRRRPLTASVPEDEPVDIETWLDQSAAAGGNPAINGSDDAESEGENRRHPF